MSLLELDLCAWPSALLMVSSDHFSSFDIFKIGVKRPRCWEGWVDAMSVGFDVQDSARGIEERSTSATMY